MPPSLSDGNMAPVPYSSWAGNTVLHLIRGWDKGTVQPQETDAL